jgi:hypothetical protein
LRTGIFVFGLIIFIGSAIRLLFADIIDQLGWKILSSLERVPAFARLLKKVNFVHLLYWLREYRFTLPILPFVILVYIWLVSAGTWTTWISPTRYYANLARGFQNGNLFIPTRPSPELLKLENPYDPSARAGIPVPPDITFYKGKYYLYWGPVPSLILVILHPIYHGRIGDLFLVFGFVCGIFLMQFRLAMTIWDKWFKTLPRWILGMSILLMGLRTPVTFMLNNYFSARIYEAAVTGGQFFLMGGLLAAFDALRKPSSRNWMLALAGFMWAFAFGTRLFLALPVGIMTILTLFWLLEEKGPRLKKIQNTTFLTLPLALGLICLGWYNWARFGSVTESGLYYQLAGVHIQKYYRDLIDPMFIVQNTYNYLLNPFRVERQFPFLYLEYGNRETVFSFYPLPSIYLAQYITGLLYTAPFILFAIIPFIRMIQGYSKKTSRGKGSINIKENRLMHWVIAALGGSFLAAFGFLMVFFWAAMRYMEDFMPSLITLSVIGFWFGCHYLSKRPVESRWFIALGVLLAVVSISISTLLAISINDARFILVRLFSPK